MIAIFESNTFVVFRKIDGETSSSGHAFDSIILHPITFEFYKQKNIYENKQIYPIRMAIGNAVLYCLYFLSRVFGSVEAREQEQEHHTMQSNPEHKVFWIIAFTEGQLELMTEYGNKLYHLECCQMLFPPNVLLVFWAHRRNHIIEIHNNVNEWVEHSKECAMAACKSEIETTTTFIRW